MKLVLRTCIGLIFERSNLSVLAKELGILAQLIYRWRKGIEYFGSGSFLDNGKS